MLDGEDLLSRRLKINPRVPPFSAAIWRRRNTLKDNHVCQVNTSPQSLLLKAFSVLHRAFLQEVVSSTTNILSVSIPACSSAGA